MPKFFISRYNQDTNWVAEYAPDMMIYDRSDYPIAGAAIMPNLGTDLADKFHFIVSNYENLPDVCVYTKANLFKYITKEEFDRVKDNTEFTPLLTQNHRTYKDESGKDVCFYKDGLYHEINNYFYLNSHPCKYFNEVKELLKMDQREYNAFAPGSNYILTKEDIRRHPKEFYIKLMNYLIWCVYPGEAQMIERSLYYIWGTDTINGI